MAINLEKTAPAQVSPLAVFMNGVYSWMFGGLLLTAVIAWLMAGSQEIVAYMTEHVWILFAAAILEVGIVIWLTGRIDRMSASAASMWFIFYAALNGVFFSTVFLSYDMKSIAGAFFTSAGMFGAMSAYGFMTKRSLVGVGAFMFAGLVGILIAMIVNMFLNSSTLGYVISVIGVVVFLGLTAADTQKLRMLGSDAPLDDPAAVRKGVILGALTLYLDFINLFLMLLRLFGDRR